MFVLLCILSGALIGACGIGYKLGGKGNVRPIQPAAFLALFGTVVFGLLGWGSGKTSVSSPWSAAPFSA